MQTVTTYLILKNALGFLDFVQQVFGAEIKEKHLTETGDLMHAELIIGNSSIMIGGANEQWDSQPAGMFINVNNADETYNKAIELGATSIMPPDDKDYGRSCGVSDVYGNTWWITSPL